MRLGRRALLAALAAVPARADDTLRALARRAAIYLAPPSAMYRRRHRDIVERGDPLNRLIRQLAPQDGLLTASAWLDLSGEPMFLTLPPMEDRFYSAVLLDPCARVCAQVSRRTAGDAPRPHMIAGPAWTGDAPAEAATIRTPAPSVWLRLRIATTDDEADIDIARGLQARSLLETPDQRNERRILEMRELMRFRTYPPPEPVADWPEPRRSDRFDPFDAGLAMLRGFSLPEADRRELELLARLRLRPGHRFDARAFNEADRDSIAAGIADARAEIAESGPAASDDSPLHRAWIATTALAAPTAVERP